MEDNPLARTDDMFEDVWQDSPSSAPEIEMFPPANGNAERNLISSFRIRDLSCDEILEVLRHEQNERDMTACADVDFYEASEDPEKFIEVEIGVPTIPGTLVFSYLYSRELKLATYAGVGAFSMLGVLMRYFVGKYLGDNQLEVTEPNSIVAHNLPANMLGCFLMGIVVGFQDHIKPPHPTVYAGLTAGLCGCLTTFSSWNLEVALLAMSPLDPDNNTDPDLLGKTVSRAVFACALGFAASWGMLHAGLSVA
eukprot:gene26736-32849_t